MQITKRLSCLLFAIVCSCTQWLYAQSMNAQIDDMGDYFRLTFTVNSSDATSFTPPSLADFEVLSGVSKSTMSNIQVVNGHMSRSSSTSFTYILAPRKAGHLTIGSASVKVGGKTVMSRPVSFNAQAASGKAGQSSSSKARQQSGGSYNSDIQQTGSPVTERDLFIDVTPSRTKVHEQEAVLLTYRIHARVGVALSNTQLTTKPDFKGLISQDIPLPNNQIETHIEHRANGTYKTGTLLQYVVFPQQSGKITIPSISFDCTVIQQDHDMNIAEAFFNGGGTIGVNVKRKVAPITLDVQALPQPKPAGYAGAVGKFSIKGQLLNQGVRTNDVATYRITLSGTGNTKLITAPQVTFPKDFDTFDAKTNDKTKVTPNGMSGDVTFDYTFVPRNVGKYTIPATEFVYYDTEANAYRTLTIPAFTIDVKKGDKSRSDVDKQLALLQSDIHDIHKVDASNARLFTKSAMLNWNSWGYWLSTIILLVIFAVALKVLSAFAGNRADTVGRKRRGAAKQSQRLLAEAEKQINDADGRNFYATIARAVQQYVADTFNVGTAELTKEHMAELLAGKGVSPNDVEAFIKLLDECEMAQYAPNSDAERHATLQEAKRIIQTIIR